MQTGKTALKTEHRKSAPLVGADPARPGCDDASLIDPEALKTMQERGGVWYAYQNHELTTDVRDIPHLKFLRVGTECTFPHPPKHYPGHAVSDSHVYPLVGKVDVERGKIESYEGLVLVEW